MFEDEKEALIRKRGIKKEQLEELEQRDKQDSKSEPLMDKTEDSDSKKLLD